MNIEVKEPLVLTVEEIGKYLFKDTVSLLDNLGLIFKNYSEEIKKDHELHKTFKELIESIFNLNKYTTEDLKPTILNIKSFFEFKELINKIETKLNYLEKLINNNDYSKDLKNVLNFSIFIYAKRMFFYYLFFNYTHNKYIYSKKMT